MFSVIYSVEFDNEVLRIWQRDLGSHSKYKSLHSQWRKKDLVAAAKVIGDREKRNLTAVYMSDGSRFEVEGRTSIKQIQDECQLVMTHQSCLVDRRAVNRIKMVKNKIISLGVVNHLCLFPVAWRLRGEVDKCY